MMGGGSNGKNSCLKSGPPYSDKTKQVKIDVNQKLPGRGAYICKCADCIEQARKKNKLKRALRTEVSSDIYNKLSNMV